MTINEMSVNSWKLHCAVVLFSLPLLFRVTTGGTVPPTGVGAANIKDFPYIVSVLNADLDEFLGIGVLVSGNLIFCEEIL